jgi:antitoxin Phd
MIRLVRLVIMELNMSKQQSKAKKQKNIWQIQEAKAKFSQLVEDAGRKGYQTITKKGEPIAVIMSKEEFDKIKQPKVSFLNFFKEAPHQEITLEIQRAKDLPRELDL